MTIYNNHLSREQFEALEREAYQITVGPRFWFGVVAASTLLLALIGAACI